MFVILINVNTKLKIFFIFRVRTRKIYIKIVEVLIFSLLIKLYEISHSVRNDRYFCIIRCWEGWLGGITAQPPLPTVHENVNFTVIQSEMQWSDVAVRNFISSTHQRFYISWC